MSYDYYDILRREEQMQLAMRAQNALSARSALIGGLGMPAKFGNELMPQQTQPNPVLLLCD